MGNIDNLHVYYRISDCDRLITGQSLKIKHMVSLDMNKTDITYLSTLSLAELQQMREDYAGKETATFAELQNATAKWEHLAARTMLIDNAIAYLKVPADTARRITMG